MTSTKTTRKAVLFSALLGFLSGSIIVFIGVSGYLGKYSADIAARKAASQLNRDVRVLEHLANGQQDKAIELVEYNARQKYRYLSNLRHDTSELTRSEVKAAMSNARNFLGDALTAPGDAE